MTTQTLTLGKEKYVILPEKAFRRLQARAEDVAVQDRGDVAEVKRRKARGPSRPYMELRKKLGLA